MQEVPCAIILSVGLSKLGRLWAFPIGIMVINILGCFLIGVLYGYFKSKATTDPVLPLLLMTGVFRGLYYLFYFFI